METEQTNQEVKEQQEQQKPNMIMDAHSAAEKLKEQNDRMEANIKQLQELRSEQILSGTANAGQTTQSKTEEQKQKESAMEFWKGTGIDKAIEKNG